MESLWSDRFICYITRKRVITLLFFAALFLFSFWLMWHTFDYKDNTIYIAAKVHSDFANHIPLIRSFSYGSNFPPQNPIFAGEPLRYHFLFYMIVGLLEKIGLPLDFALNIPSALSFFSLLLIIYFLAKKLFSKNSVALLSVVFFLFNGSFSFLEFFKSNPISINAFSQIIQSRQYLSFAPYGPGIVSAFWNLNIYTNQRHLAVSMFILLLVTFLIIRREKENRTLCTISVAGLLIGTLFYIHSSIFVVAFVVLGMLFLTNPQKRIPILFICMVALAMSFPRLILLKETSAYSPHIQIGFLIPGKVTFNSVVYYWFMNLGLFLVLGPLGFILAPKTAKKIWVAFLPLFIIANLIQFSPEMAGNHKIFNVFVIVNNMFAAWFLVFLWEKNTLAKLFLPFIFFIMVLSGIIDFFPLKNDSYSQINDYPNDQRVKWIVENTPRNSVFLNSSYNYHPASIAGRQIYLGWPYFIWGVGYDIAPHLQVMNSIYESHSKEEVCQLSINNKIDYITLEDTSKDIVLPRIDLDFFQNNFKPAYEDRQNIYYIIDVKENCYEQISPPTNSQ